MRNKVIAVVALLFVIIFALTLTGCSPKITDITVDWGNLEATIVAGTDLDLSGLSVTGTLKKDEEQIEITPDGEEEGYTVDLGGFNKDVPGTYTITITYQDFSQTFTVTVEALVMTGITVEGTLTNPVYTGADTIDLTGLTIKKVFNNGTEQNLEYTQVTTDIATVASVSGTEKTLTISYTEGEVVKTATITIQVSDISLDHIGISGDITNEIFAGDTTIDLAGLTVTKYYNDGTTGAVSLVDLTTDIETIAASAGEGKTLTLSYTEGGI
ncbi:MAG: bacterial Ig-like domain-containing protein, partial [Clostridia bacterium]